MKKVLVMAVAIMFSAATVGTAQTTKKKTYQKKDSAYMSKDSMKMMKDTSSMKRYKPMKNKMSKSRKDSMM